MVAGCNPFSFQKHRFHILHFPNSTGLFTKPTGRHYTNKYRFSPDIAKFSFQSATWERDSHSTTSTSRRSIEVKLGHGSSSISRCGIAVPERRRRSWNWIASVDCKAHGGGSGGGKRGLGEDVWSVCKGLGEEEEEEELLLRRLRHGGETQCGGHCTALRLRRRGLRQRAR
jgi:hypothetical protein